MMTFFIVIISLFLLSALNRRFVDKETNKNLNRLLILLIALIVIAMIFIIPNLK